MHNYAVSALRSDIARLRTALHDGDIRELEIAAVRAHAATLIEQMRGHPLEPALHGIDDLLGSMQFILKTRPRPSPLTIEPAMVA